MRSAGRPAHDLRLTDSRVATSFPLTQYNNDESSNSSSNEDDDEDEYLESKPRGVGGRGSSSRSRGGRPSQKVQDLSQRLSDVTGIPLIKCLETISKIPIEELGRIDPNAPIPTNYLPQGMNGHAAGLLGSALVGNNPSLSSPGLPLSSTVSSSSTLPLNTTNSSSTPKPPPKPKAPRKSSSSAHADSPAQLGPDGLPIKKATRTQRPHDPNRPNFSYSALIGQAILNHPEKRLRLAEIYDYVTSNCELSRCVAFCFGSREDGKAPEAEGAREGRAMHDAREMVDVRLYSCARFSYHVILRSLPFA